MDHEFWHDKWQRKEIGFHQESINQYLQSHWSELGLSRTDNVFVPLCGKTKDMFWIGERGHPVLGVELSDLACKDLFADANLTAKVHHSEDFTHYQHNDIDILCGDFFNLKRDHVSKIKAVYDRAALIALPAPMRQKYVAHLNNILPSHCKLLLVSLEYPQSEMQGPPFSVGNDEIKSLFSTTWDITTITENILGRDDPFSKRKGLSDMKECIYLLRKKE